VHLLDMSRNDHHKSTTLVSHATYDYMSLICGLNADTSHI